MSFSGLVWLHECVLFIHYASSAWSVRPQKSTNAFLSFDLPLYIISNTVSLCCLAPSSPASLPFFFSWSRCLSHPLFLLAIAGLSFLMRWFWLCFTSAPLSECLCVHVRIGIPAYSTFLLRNWLPLMGQGKPLKGKLWLSPIFFSPYFLSLLLLVAFTLLSLTLPTPSFPELLLLFLLVP